MNSTILFATDFPHGTPDGYAKGCKGAHCPTSDAPCRDVYARFQGDYSFRKRVHAGENPATIIREELAAAEAVRVAEKEAARRARMKPKVAAAPKRHQRPRSTNYVEQVVALHATGLTDTQIATRMGLERYQVAASRRHKSLPPNVATQDGPTIPEQVRELYNQGLRDREIAARINRHYRHVAGIRRKLGLPRHFNARFDSWPEVIAMHEQGKSVREIADHFGFLPTSVHNTISKHAERVKNG